MKFKFKFSTFIDTVFQFPTAYHFIREHRLWHGFWKYGWVTVLMILAGLLFSMKFYSTFIGWWSSANIHNLWEAGEETGRLISESRKMLFSSSFKYLVFIFMEIIIFHSVGRTIEIISEGNDRKPTFNIFLTAQIRMINISIRSWIKETIATFIITFALGLISMEFLKMPLVLLVQCYYIGFAMLDNYNERLGMNIKESAKFTQNFADVSLAVGLVVYLIMLIPFAGAFIGPLLGGVTATLILNKLVHPDTNDEYEYMDREEL